MGQLAGLGATNPVEVPRRDRQSRLLVVNPPAANVSDVDAEKLTAPAPVRTVNPWGLRDNAPSVVVDGGNVRRLDPGMGKTAPPSP